MESKEREFRETLAARDEEHKDALEAKMNESSEERVSLEVMPEDESSIKIGVVDVQRVIEESQKGIEARRYFEGLISLRSEEKLGDVELKLIGEIVKDIGIIVKEYAKKEGFTYIKDKLEGGVIYNDESFDVTDEIIELYDRKVTTPREVKTN